MSWVACLADARSSDTYASWLTEAGLTVTLAEPHDGALKEMVCAIGSRLFAAEVLAGLNKLNLANIDLDAAKRMARQALAAIDEDLLGYVILCAVRH